jgi:uncharacterized protein (TIGR02145 family)
VEQRCGSNGFVETKCGTGNNFHNPQTQFCDDNEVLDKCNGWTYNPSSQFCFGDIAYNKCNGSTYNPENIVCCNNSQYSISTYFCYGNIAYNKCGGKEYTPSSGFCYGNEIFRKCGGNDYNIAIEYCSKGTTKTYGSVTDGSGQIYKTVVIGTQTWMAKNLNYNVTGSLCYGKGCIYDFSNNGSGCTITLSDAEIQANCEKYGRLYNYSAAMSLPSKCNRSSTNDADCTIETPHQGVCPSGWHIPSDAEWTTLINYVVSNDCSSYGEDGKDICVADILKSRSDWDYSNGSDTYGFSALPGGYGYDSDYDDFGYFGNGGGYAGNYGGWWGSGGSFGMYMWSMHSSTGSHSLSSVRCVMD